MCSLLLDDSIVSSIDKSKILKSFLDHIMFLYDILPSHVDIEKINNYHHNLIRKNKRSNSRFSRLYEDEINEIDISSNSIQSDCLSQIYKFVQVILRDYSSPIDNKYVENMVYKGLVTLLNNDLRLSTFRLIENVYIIIYIVNIK